MKRISVLFLAIAFGWAQESLRSALGKNEEKLHLQGELRIGWIAATNTKSTFAAGGHLHAATPFWHGLRASLSIYSVNDFGWGPSSANEDFFGSDAKGYTFVSEAFVEYDRGIEVKIGRQNIETPHADSDDIRMVPNYFEAVTAKATLRGTTLQAGYITRMAGWENGANPAKFVRLGKVLGLGQKIDGMGYMEVQGSVAGYAWQIWGYNLSDVAHICYIEAAKELEWGDASEHVTLQLDVARGAGRKYMGYLHSKTAGIISQTTYKEWTWTLAANKEYGKSAAFGSFGGGPFFTSMEDLTIDTLASKEAKSYVLGTEYGFAKGSIGAMAGRFFDGNYDAKEYDLYANVTLPYGFVGDFVFAKVVAPQDRYIARCIIKRSFQ